MPDKKKTQTKKKTVKKKEKEPEPPTNAEIMREGFKVLGKGMAVGFRGAQKGMRAMRSKAGWGRRNEDDD